MPRKERRLGIKYIHNEKECVVTFFKRRVGLFKCSVDLSALTGASVAVVLETNIGKMHSFGTPSADPIINGFLDGVPPTNTSTCGVLATRIGQLQSEVAQLEDEYTMEYKRTKLYIQRMKEIQVGNPGMTSNLIFSKEEDLNKLFNDLSRVQENIRHQLPLLHHGHQLHINGPSATKNLLPPRGLSWDFHMKLPQVFQSTPSSLAQHSNFVLSPIPNQVPELPLQLDLDLQTCACPHDIPEKPHNYGSVDSTFKHNLEDSSMLIDSSGNNFVVEDPFGYEHWAYALSDQSYYEEFLQGNAYLGCNGTNVGELSMENGGYDVDAP
ncbi:agamous-like MADS-box protein AGL28 [Triticum dicoccoides]|uniref:agamous-like MADS-box protein AGL28 n=1 Tax=Triticum dicoccoides TaxID=85692 RepID=UPI00189107B7|nr:agamous-like MADS-box protein AGL28 [Triticum dicoccoides]